MKQTNTGPAVRRALTHPRLCAAAMAFAASLLIWGLLGLYFQIAPFGEMSMCTNDAYAQYVPFLSEMWDVLHGEGSALYSVNGGLGYPFFQTALYYLVSPFNLLLLLFDKADVPAAANIIIMLKSACIAAGMGWYLGSRSRPQHVTGAAVFALVYAFSAYFMAYSSNFIWMDVIALVPFILWGMEHLESRTGKAVYTCTLSAAICCNFYMAAIVCVFLALYYVVLRLRFDRRGLREATAFVCCSLTAALLAGVVLVPAAAALLEDNAGRMQMPAWEWYSGLPYILRQHLPVADLTRVSHDRGAVNIFYGTVPAFLAGLYLFVPGISRRKRYGTLFLVLLYLCAMENSWLNHAFHGFYQQRQIPNRFAFLYVFLCVQMACETFCRLHRMRWKPAAAAAGVYALGILWVGVTGSDEKLAASVLGAAALLTSALVFSVSRDSRMLLVLAGAEAFCSAASISICQLSGSYLDMQDYLQAANEADGRYREEVLAGDVTNAPSLYGYAGMTAFSSVINPDTSAMLGRMGYASGENYYRHTGFTPVTDMLLGVGTLYSDQDEDLPYPYRMTAQHGNVRVYTSPYALNLGVDISLAPLETHYVNKFQNLNALFETELFRGVYIETEAEGALHKTDNSNYTVEKAEQGDTVRITLASFGAENAYLCTRTEKAADLTVFVNDTERAFSSYRNCILYLGDIQPEDVVVLEFAVRERWQDVGLSLFVSTLSPEDTDRLWERMRTRTWQNQLIEGNRISAVYEAPEDTSLLVTVPYDKGWSVRVNGQTVPLESWEDAFCRIDLKKGYSFIEMVYEPPGLKAGLVCTAAGLSLCGAWILTGRDNTEKHTRKNRHRKYT